MHRGAVAILGLIAPFAVASAEVFSKDGYSIQPPPGFAPAGLDAYRGSRFGVISADPQAGGFLSAAFTNDKIDGTATMLISAIDGSFSTTPAARDQFAIAAVKHFEGLKLNLAIQRVDLVSSGVARVEVRGIVMDEGKQRHLLIAAMPGKSRHQVVMFSLPVGALPRLAAAIRTSLETFENHQGQTFWTGDKIAASAALLGAGVLAWMLLSQSRTAAQSVRATRR